MKAKLREYLQDPFLARLFEKVRSASPLRSISVDLTRRCNLRCTGCYFFNEGMDDLALPETSESFEDLVLRERERGTNFVTVVGGEPSLYPDRLRRLNEAFTVSVATNGTKVIPKDGLEELSIGVSIWGNEASDTVLRGNGYRRVFREALVNYRGDERAFFYLTVASGHEDGLEETVDRCIENGNRVLFNFYGDLDGQGGGLDHRRGFEGVLSRIGAVIDRYPEKILTTAYLAKVVAEARLYDESWGYEVCPNVSVDLSSNQARLRNGKPFNPHFRAYNADFATTRRCCTGLERECDSCFDTWEHFAWIMLNMRKHLRSPFEFGCWLTTTYLFYAMARLVDGLDEAGVLTEIHRRTRAALSESGPHSESSPEVSLGVHT